MRRNFQLLNEETDLKKIIMFSFLLLSFTPFLFPQSVVIKSLKSFADNNETAFPLIVQNGDGPKRLTIEFDAQSDFEPYLSIVFRFCDKNWIPYNNIFLLNPGKNVAYNLSFSVLPQTVKDAHYHFMGSYPDNRGFVNFPFSGKWMFFITDSHDTTQVYGYGKFFVVNNDIAVYDTLKREQLEDKVYFPADLAKIFNVTTNFNLPDKFYPASVDRVEIVTNRVLDYPAIVDRNGNTNTRQYYWNGDRKFSFVARDILPGNGYRQVDLRNTNEFNAKDVNAHLDGLEYSRFFKQTHRDLYGASILTNYKDDYAAYLNVTFSIRPPNEMPGGVYLVGAFNNWQITPAYQMKNNYGVYSITVPLKRGIYDYQYVIANLSDDKIVTQDWVTLEGNNWNTSNIYHVFVYYKDPDYGGYDRIIGYQQIKSN